MRDLELPLRYEIFCVTWCTNGVAFGNVLAGAERLSGSSAVKIIATSSISFKITKTFNILFHSISEIFKFREPDRGKTTKKDHVEISSLFCEYDGVINVAVHELLF